jgi:RNA polymerase sigma-70 factor (ECF subfamily)
VRNELSLASFNAENFYLLLDSDYDRAALESLEEGAYKAMNASIYNPNKEREKIAQIARVILDGNFDLVGLCEVGGMETLAAFNRIYLEDRYECHLHEENSRRGIFVGALSRKGRFPGLRARNMPGAFSRNLLKLELGEAAGGLEVYVVHLKSQHGEDRGLAQRVQEVNRLCSLVRKRNCVVMGDFNGVLIRGEQQFEYDPFLALPFRDVLEAVGVPVELRRTHYHFNPGPAFNQLDYIFCSNDVEVLEAGVIEGEIPINRSQRRTLPSDHLFIKARIRPGEGDRREELARECLSHQDYLYGFVIRLTGDGELARDIVQETYARAIANLEKFGGRSSLRTWLTAIARNEAFRAVGRRKKDLRKIERLRRELNARPVRVEMDETERYAGLEQVKDGCMYALLNCLPFDMRCAFILCSLNGLSAKEASLILKRSENAVRISVARARKTIKRFLCAHCERLGEKSSCRCENMLDFSLKRSFVRRLGKEGKLPAAKRELRRFQGEIELMRSLPEGKMPGPLELGPEFKIIFPK